MKNKFILISIVTVMLLSGCNAVECPKNEEEKNIVLTKESNVGEKDGCNDKAEEKLSMEEIARLDNKGAGWGFVKKKGQKPDIPAETIEMFKKHNTYFMDLSEPKKLYLTFDEGYEAGFTGNILDTLKKCNVPAAFFITGDYFDREEELVARMVEEGHIVGNHTENHKNLHKLESPQQMNEELKSLDDKYFAKFNAHMCYMRPPEGEYSERVLALANAAGYKTVLWSFAYKDWLRNCIKGKEYAIDQVTPYFHNGAIILLHAVSKDNSDALEEIINIAENEGYSFGALSDIK